MLLWVSIAILTFVATAVIVWPLLSTRSSLSGDTSDDERRRLAVFRDRKRELERERQAGRLGDDEAEQAQADLLRQLAADLPQAAAPTAPVAPPVSRSGTWLMAAVVAALVPLIALGVYRQVGTPQLASLEAGGAPRPVGAGDVEALIAQIEQRTREFPDDGEAWAMLAEARKMQGRHADAVAAFEKAVERLPEDARLFTDFAESAALLAGGEFAGRPMALLERALKADSSEPRAIALMGAAQYRLGNLEQASRYLTTLQNYLEPGSDEAAQIADILKRIDVQLAQAGNTPPPRPAVPGSESPSASAAQLRGTVTVDPSLVDRVASGGTLYVVARQSGGPPIPVAALRVPDAGFPATFTLDDSNAMDPSRRLSAAASLDLEARLSRSGDATRRPGDLFGQLPGVRPGQTDLRIVIDRVVAP